MSSESQTLPEPIPAHLELFRIYGYGSVVVQGYAKCKVST